MIKHLNLIGDEKELIFQEKDTHYNLRLYYLEDVGYHNASVYIDGEFQVKNLLKPMNNIFKGLKKDIHWFGLYDTYIDREDRDESMMAYGDLKEELGKRYKLIYIVDGESWELAWIDDLTRNPTLYYKK